jgi:formylglycine-generating enzyme required for sulfatase activity
VTSTGDSIGIEIGGEGNDARAEVDAHADVPTARAVRTAVFPGMVWIPGGTFVMGSDHHYPEEGPAHTVAVDGFWMDQHTVTNAEFRRFIDETGYVTIAERPLRPEDYPGIDPARLVPGSAVFHKPSGPVDRRNCMNWWTYVPGASWAHPEGLDSDVDGRLDHPVVHVAYADVEAYAAWAGKQIPTEAQWERAARGGLDGSAYCWGDELTPGGRHMANTWQGEFPWENSNQDGYEGTAPVASFPPNGYGLFDMAGNVWEWTRDWYFARHEAPIAGKSCCVPRNPRGPRREASFAPAEGGRFPRKVLKGGSFLCAPNYCFRYRPAARFPESVDTSTCHIGFRLIRLER